MNGETAKLIRKVASVRGNTSPRFIRSLKRNYYDLTSEERELQKIEWRTEVDDFIDSLKSEYENKLSTEKGRLKTKISNHKSRAEKVKITAEQAKGSYQSLLEKIEEAPFSERLKYLFTGSLIYN